MSLPSVSVIIPTYNRAGFLPAAIQSVLEQSYQQVEVIVVDDASTDDTETAIQRYKDKILYIRTEHGGPAHARNVGMNAASGKYIAFLDSDDTYLPGKLELQVSFMEDHPDVGMVYTEFSSTSENGQFEAFYLQSWHSILKVKGWRYEDLFSGRGEFLTPASDIPVTYYTGNLFTYALMGPIIPSPTILFPKNILGVVGLQNRSYELAEDYEFIVRICKHFKVAFLNTPTYVYHRHADQTSYFFINVRLENNNDIPRWIKGYSAMRNAVLDWGYNDKEFYAQHREVIDPRLAELYHVIGLKWLQYGDGNKAGESFKQANFFVPNKIKYLIYQLLCFIPGIIFRGAKRIKDRFSLFQ